MRRIATKIRCVPRWGIEGTNVRLIDLDVDGSTPEPEFRALLQQYFRARGIADAVYDLALDDNGYFAIINDDAYEDTWGTPVL